MGECLWGCIQTIKVALLPWYVCVWVLLLPCWHRRRGVGFEGTINAITLPLLNIIIVFLFNIFNKSLWNDQLRPKNSGIANLHEVLFWTRLLRSSVLIRVGSGEIFLQTVTMATCIQRFAPAETEQNMIHYKCVAAWCLPYTARSTDTLSLISGTIAVQKL